MPELDNRPLMFFCGNCLAIAIVKRVIRPFKEVFPPDGKTNVPFSINAQCPICGEVSRGILDEFFYHPDMERIVRDHSTLVNREIEKERRAANDSLSKSLEG